MVRFAPDDPPRCAAGCSTRRASRSAVAALDRRRLRQVESAGLHRRALEEPLARGAAGSRPHLGRRGLGRARGRGRRALRRLRARTTPCSRSARATAASWAPRSRAASSSAVTSASTSRRRTSPTCARTFDDPRLEIVCGDVESAEFGEPLDAAYSFLTFKHIYPSFAAALANIGRQLRPGGRVVFDLIEGSREYFHRDQVTFMREYTRPEAAGIVARAGLAAGRDRRGRARARAAPGC